MGNELLPGYLPEKERIEAFLWANLCCLAEKIDSPAEKQRILHSSNGALQSIRYFSAGNAYALTGLVVDSEGINIPFVVFREKPEDSEENASYLLMQEFNTVDYMTTKGVLVGQALEDCVDLYLQLREDGLVKWAIQAAKLSSKGLSIAGHGRGAAIANLLAVELVVDHGKDIPVRLRTFGAPRVFSMTTAESIRHFAHYDRSNFTRYINDNDCFPSLPIRRHELGHIGLAAKFDKRSSQWQVGKFEDIPVEKDHPLAPHFFQGSGGYIANLRVTIENDITGTSLDINREVMQIKKEYTVQMKLRETIEGAATIYDNYSRKRDHRHVNQQNERKIFEGDD